MTELVIAAVETGNDAETGREMRTGISMAGTDTGTVVKM